MGYFQYDSFMLYLLYAIVQAVFVSRRDHDIYADIALFALMTYILLAPLVSIFIFLKAANRLAIWLVLGDRK